jgi:hypothetical protein
MIGSKIIGQYTCIIAKMYAVLMPNSSMPLTDSNAPIICHRNGRNNPGAPAVVIVPTEYSNASANEPNAPRKT